MRRDRLVRLSGLLAAANHLVGLKTGSCAANLRSRNLFLSVIRYLRKIYRMTLRCGIVFLGLAVPLLAQGTPDPNYYRSRERFNFYLYRTYTDPVRLGWLLLDSAKDTWLKEPREWDCSAQSYSYRVASGLGRRIVRNTALVGFEAILREDSRYRPSLDSGFRKRILFALRYSVLAYKPDGSTELAYGQFGAGVLSAAASSMWQPQSIAGDALLFGVAQSALDRAQNNLLTEFEPDLKRLGKKTWNQIFRK